MQIAVLSSESQYIFFIFYFFFASFGINWCQTHNNHCLYFAEIQAKKTSGIIFLNCFLKKIQQTTSNLVKNSRHIYDNCRFLMFLAINYLKLNLVVLVNFFYFDYKITLKNQKKKPIVKI